MSVGGKVVETIVLDDRVWVDTGECAIYVERSNEARAISDGDDVWWHGRTAFWTPRNRAFADYPLQRIGYSGVSRPTDSTTGVS